MRGLAIVVLLASARAGAHPILEMPEAERPADEPVRTYLDNDESFGQLMAHGRWTFYGAGLGLTHTLAGHLELGLEASVLRLDSPDDSDPRHGFAFRAGGTLGYRIAVSHLANIDWGLEPQVGVATSAVFAMGSGAQHEVFGGLRASFRAVLDHRPSRHFGAARGIGGHLTLRVSRAEQHFAAACLIGYDWGL